nr:iron uptake system protein EfeO [Microbacterium bovistercoris]
MTAHRALALSAALSVAALALTGCVAKSDVATDDALTVTSTDSDCTVSTASAASGTLAFDVTNAGTAVTEFYLLAHDGLRIVGEVENIAPGARRTLTVVAQPGDYFTVCKPGMVGEGVGRAAFTVSGDAVTATGSDAAQKTHAVDLYVAFVKDQTGQLLPAVKTFAAAYEAGDDAAAREQFPRVRAYYERIEPIAESLGDLDPKIDYREVDAKAEGLEWTGFHRIEKDLWVPAKDARNADGATPAWQDWAPSTAAERKTIGAQLVTDVQSLYDYVHGDEFAGTLEQQGVAALSNGAIGLLDEVAKGKITGEEDWWSGTDLWDFAANVEGSKMAFSLVRDLAESKGESGASLVARIDKGYAALQQKLATYGSAEKGYVAYEKLTDQDRSDLTNLINTLAEPLSQLTATVLS